MSTPAAPASPPPPPLSPALAAAIADGFAALAARVTWTPALSRTLAARPEAAA